MSSPNEIKRIMRDYINKIDEDISKNDFVAMKNLHCELDGKYQAIIPDWGKSMYNWRDNFGFHEITDKESLIHNLKMMRSKLEGFIENYNPNFNMYQKTDSNKPSIQVNNSLVNNNDISINFESIYDNVNNMSSLSSKDTEELINRIKILEELYNSSETKKEKWNKISNILKWVADKSVDVGIQLIPIIISILK